MTLQTVAVGELHLARAASGASPNTSELRMSKLTHQSRWRSIAKTLTWRVVASTTTFAISYLITGDFAWAGSIAGLEATAKMFLYYAHERSWAHLEWGLS